MTEDRVPYDIAKLLKEKGFDEAIETLITPNGIKYFLDTNSVNNNKHSTIKNSEINIYSEDVCCPTLQMVCKWLREVHNLFIQVELYQYTFEGEMKFQLEFFRYGSRLMKKPSMIFSSYEEATEAAIKYCLENLI